MKRAWPTSDAAAVELVQPPLSDDQPPLEFEFVDLAEEREEEPVSDQVPLSDLDRRAHGGEGEAADRPSTLHRSSARPTSGFRRFASTNRTRWPYCARTWARFRATVVFPSPAERLVTRTLRDPFCTAACSSAPRSWMDSENGDGLVLDARGR